MTTQTWRFPSIALLGAVLAVGACSETDEDDGATDDTGATAEPSYEDAYNAGYDDARASNPSCFECNYEDHWNIEDYTTDELRECYLGGFVYAYDIYCHSACYTDEVEPKGCCDEALEFVQEQKHSLGLYGTDFTCPV